MNINHLNRDALIERFKEYLNEQGLTDHLNVYTDGFYLIANVKTHPLKWVKKRRFSFAMQYVKNDKFANWQLKLNINHLNTAVTGDFKF